MVSTIEFLIANLLTGYMKTANSEKEIPAKMREFAAILYKLANSVTATAHAMDKIETEKEVKF